MRGVHPVIPGYERCTPCGIPSMAGVHLWYTQHGRMYTLVYARVWEVSTLVYAGYGRYPLPYIPPCTPWVYPVHTHPTTLGIPPCYTARPSTIPMVSGVLRVPERKPWAHSWEKSLGMRRIQLPASQRCDGCSSLCA